MDKVKALGAAFFGHRMSIWLWASIAGVVALFFVAPHMTQVLGFKIVLLTVAGWIGYFISRGLERGRRPHLILQAADAARNDGDDDLAFQHEITAALLLTRRAIIVAACLVASALGG